MLGNVLTRNTTFYRQTSPTKCEDDAVNVAPTSTAAMPTSNRSTELMGSGEVTGMSNTTLSTHLEYSSSNSAKLYTTLGMRPTIASVCNTEPKATNMADTSNLCGKCLNSTSDLCDKCLNSTRGGGSQSVIICSLLVSVGLPVVLALSHWIIM